MEAVTLTTEMVVVLGLLGCTVFLFAFDILRVDVTALLIMVVLGVCSQIPGLESVADPKNLFDGFASNAVISIMAVMILGAGLDRTGIMNKVAASILKYGGSTETRIVPIVSGTVGIISSFMQNVGAAALFLPVVSRIAARTGTSMARLCMPMGFCAILGGTVTMVGSSPLILLNDLIETANRNLPTDAQMQTFSLFSVTPVGLALVASGIAYFVFAGAYVLPKAGEKDDAAAGQSVGEYLKRVYQLKADIIEVEVPIGSDLEGRNLVDLGEEYHLYIIGTYYKGTRVVAPINTTTIETPCRLAVLGRRKVINEFAEENRLRVRPLKVFSEAFAPTTAGVAELVIPPDSTLIGKSAKELSFRATYGFSLLAIHRGGETLSLVETEEHHSTRVGKVPFQAGDTLVVHTMWDRLARLKRNDRNFVVVTSDFPQEELHPEKVGWALGFFAIVIGLILFTDMRLSLCLMVGAVGMIITQVLSIDDAYKAIAWNTVFLLASLIPLGLAVQSTGTAQWIAQTVFGALTDWPVWSLQAVVAVLSTVFTLVISNVGAVVLLVPLAVSIATVAGADPALFALTVAISTSNSFLIPTHQVNALVMGPGGYSVRDYMRAGGIMTVIFLVVSLAMINLIF